MAAVAVAAHCILAKKQKARGRNFPHGILSGLEEK